MDSTSNMISAPIPSPIRRLSKNFLASDADVVFLSSNNVLFHIHRKYLDANAGAFPSAEFETHGEVVPLTETSTTLELLFLFVYPRRHPTLEATPIETLAPLAEAAEKYEVFSAINMCNVRMRNALPEHAVAVFRYASRHGYKDLSGKAACWLLDIPLGEIIKMLPAEWVVPWILYHECWSRAAFTAVNEELKHYRWSERDLVCTESADYSPCRLDVKVLPAQLWANLGEKRSREALLSLYDINLTPNAYTCNGCHYKYTDRIPRLISALDAVPSFDTFL